MYYKEIVIGSLEKGARYRSSIIPVHKIDEFIQYAQDEEEEMYVSYYNYSEEILNYFNYNKSVKQYPGKIYLDKIYLDFDISLEKLRDHLNLFNIDETCQVFFSGTGFHIHLENIYNIQGSDHLHYDLKKIIPSIYPNVDDIFDKTRIIRVQNTINKKSNYYKVYLSKEEIENLTLEEIQQLAEKPRLVPRLEIKDLKIINLPILQKEIVATHLKQENEYTKIATCIHTMYDSIPKEGSRHNKMLRMASVFRRSGVPEKGITDLLYRWANERIPIMDIQKLVTSIFKTPLEYGCNDPMMIDSCSTQCYFYKNKNLVTTKSINDLEKDFINFLNINSNDIINLKDYLGLNSDYKVYPGELVMIIGDTGIGKTAFIQNICIQVNLPSLYLSLEVSSHLLFRRFLQIKRKLSKYKLYDYYKDSSNQKELTIGLEHIKCQFTGPKIDDLSKLILSSNAKVVIIDTLDGIEIPYAQDSVSQTERLAVKLKELAQKHNIIIIGVHHISKQASSNNILTVHSGKGSSSLEQKADKVISIEGEKANNERIIRSLKARDEQPFKVKLIYNFDTFEMNKENLNEK